MHVLSLFTVVQFQELSQSVHNTYLVVSYGIHLHQLFQSDVSECISLFLRYISNSCQRVMIHGAYGVVLSGDITSIAVPIATSNSRCRAMVHSAYSVVI